MRAYERFLRYIQISSPSCEGNGTTPSTEYQFEVARLLRDELQAMGAEQIRLTDNCFVYAEFPATKGMEALPCIGLIAHMDTAPSFNGMGVKPLLHEHYDGGDVLLPGSGAVLSVKNFPHLPKLKGKTLITTDGTTLLGADDKAGIAEIMTACEQVLSSGKAHGRIAVAFTPDEEIGEGVHSFDVKGFPAQYAYTVDGGELGELSYENFNACAAVVEFQGFSVHPGDSKDTMINAALLAMEFNAMLPSADIPRNTEGYEGFFHLCTMEGDVVNAKLTYIVRDHDANRFEMRKEMLRHNAAILNEKWGEGSVKLELQEQYRNMKEKIEPCFFLIENARKAMRAVGIKPFDAPVRGGTDGAQLCYMGLPCPNLCTGGYAFHGPYEHIAVEDMDACAAMLTELLLESNPIPEAAK